MAAPPSVTVPPNVVATTDEPPSLGVIPLNKIQIPKPDSPLKPVVLVCCGSFSPLTIMHLRIFEQARDYLQKETAQLEVIGGFFSPVHDSYGKKDLAEAKDRVEMCSLATASSEWINVATWETGRHRWSRTHEVLTHFHDYLNSQLGAQIGKEIEVRLLCGADLLLATLEDKIWPRSDLETVLSHGLVCIEREGHDSSSLIYKTDHLYRHRSHIHLVPQRVANNVSSTAVRLLIQRQMSIRYLVPESVEKYIIDHKLYTKSG